MVEGVWEGGARKDAGLKGLGPRNRCERGFQAK